MELILLKTAIELIPSMVDAIEEVADWMNPETPSQPHNYFTPEETLCQCKCGFDMTERAKGMFNAARHVAGIPFVMISGARCPAHNAEEGGAESSSHTDGEAGDFKITGSLQRSITMTACMAVGMTRFGLGRTKFHADCSTDKPTPRIWMY